MTRFYLSADFSLDASDVLLQGRTVPSLAGGASSSGTTSVAIPPSTADGAYYLIAKAEAQVLSRNPTRPITREVLLRIGPDLVVSATTAPAGAVGWNVDRRHRDDAEQRNG